jgi:riboflavin synthase
MFTGLIESIGEVVEIKPTPGGFRMRLNTQIAPELTPGESVAVNGVCLTVVSADGGGFHADISPETARVTTLTSLRLGTLVNLERPLKPDSRLGGHFVQGHVDGVGSIEELRHEGDCHWLTVKYPAVLAPYLVRKGSVAVDGISLTVAGLDEKVFDVQIVPFTWEHTNLQASRTHDAVNLECDILGKYVARVAELAGWNLARATSRETT